MNTQKPLVLMILLLFLTTTVSGGTFVEIESSRNVDFNSSNYTQEDSDRHICFNESTHYDDDLDFEDRALYLRMRHNRTSGQDLNSKHNLSIDRIE